MHASFGQGESGKVKSLRMQRLVHGRDQIFLIMATPKDGAGASKGEVGVSVEDQSVAQVNQHEIQASSGII